MARKRSERQEKEPRAESPETPRTDLTPERKPYYEGYFGTEEEEGVVREEESGDEGDRGRGAGGTEESAGGDREISSP